MNNYMIFFEIYGKKLKVHIEEETEEKAKQKVLDAIIFHKIVDIPYDEPSSIPPYNNDAFDYLMSIFGKFKP